MANDTISINNQDKTEIHLLPEMTTLSQGMMVAVDSEPTGTKSFNLTTALEGKASADDISALESELADKADSSDVAALATTVDGKADEAAMTTALAGKEDKVFVAEVNVTSYDDIDAAYHAGKTIVFKYQPAPQGNPGQVYYIKNMQYIPYAGYMCGTFDAINCGYFIVCDTNNGATRWTISRFASMTEPSGNPTNGQLLAYNSSGNVWIDSPVPSSTAEDSGKVLVVASNGTAGWGNAVGFVKNAGALTDAATITVSNLNNGFATLSTSQAALTIIDVVGTDEIVNFAIEITPSVNCTLTVQKKIGSDTPVTLKHSVAAGNALEAGKTYQVTAVGNCWTLAEFEA